MKVYKPHISVFVCILMLAAVLMPSLSLLIPSDKANASFMTAIENHQPVCTDNSTHKTRPPKSGHFAGLTSTPHSSSSAGENVTGLDSSLQDIFSQAGPAKHAASSGSLHEVYVDAATGDDSYDGSSPVALPGGIGPKRTIQAGIDAADYDCFIYVAEGIYRENIVIVDYYMDLIGAGARTTIIDGGALDSVVVIDDGDIWIEGFTIRNGHGSDGGGVSVWDSDAYLYECTVTGNSATGGGGVSNYEAGTSIIECAITNNTAQLVGGGIVNMLGVVEIYNSTVSGNSVGPGGWGGGGIANWEEGVALFGVTLANNSAPGAASRGGGFCNRGYGISIFVSCIVANNTAGYPGTNNGYTGIGSLSGGYNIDSENTCGFTEPTDQVNTDPKLGPLKDNGGPTDTQAITSGSPAFEKGSCDDYCECDFTDQRGIARPQGIYCDAGAYELVMNRTATATAANWGGQVNFTASGGGIVDLTVTSTCPGSGSWSGATFPYGFFSFKIVGIMPGSTVQVAITFPGPIPADYRYMQCDGLGHWTDITSITSHKNGDNILMLTLTDGGLGDLDHSANGKIVDPAGPCLMTVQRSPASASAAPIQQPVALPSLKVQSASLSSSSVAPGTAVTVTADVANTGTVNGGMTVKLYVNGQEEDSRGIVVEKGAVTPVTFEIMRNEPGTYSVYVGGVNAGSFIVDSFAGPGTILIISSVMLFAAFLIGLVYIYRRRQLL